MEYEDFVDCAHRLIPQLKNEVSNHPEREREGEGERERGREGERERGREREGDTEQEKLEAGISLCLKRYGSVIYIYMFSMLYIHNM